MDRSTAPVAGKAEGQRCDLLIRNATVWTVDSERRTYSPGAIAISGNRIVDVGLDHLVAERYSSSRTVDAHGGIAHPGFIEAHTHISMHLGREAFPDSRDSSGYFSSLITALNELAPEDEYASALLAATEMLRSGITTFADSGTVMEPDSVSRAIELVGIRGLLADPFVWDIEDHEWTSGLRRFPCSEISAMERLGGQVWRNQAQGLVAGTSPCGEWPRRVTGLCWKRRPARKTQGWRSPSISQWSRVMLHVIVQGSVALRWPISRK